MMHPSPKLTDRPWFMKALGLLPPYSIADVENAHSERLDRLKSADPPDGETLSHLQLAYEHALDFARFHESRRQWMGPHVERYSARQTVLGRIAELGGSAVLQDAGRHVWAFGEDLAEIMRQLVRVELTGPGVTDVALDCLCDRNVASEIVVLDLRNSAISDSGLAKLRHLKRLRCLDLRNTAVSNESTESLSAFSHLEWIQLHGTQVGFWSRRRLRRANPRLRIADDELALAPAVYEAAHEHAHVTERIAALR